MVCKWKKQQDELKEETEKLKTKKSRTGVDSSRTTRIRRLIRKYRLKQYPLAEKVVIIEFKKQRSVGLKVSGRWFKVQMRQCIRSFFGNEAADNFKGSKNW